MQVMVCRRRSVTIFVLWACAFSAFAQSRPSDSALAQSQQILDAVQQFESSHDAGAAATLQQLAQRRYLALSRLMDSNPAAVIAAALPSDIRRRVLLAAQPWIEQHVTVRGKLDVTVEDGIGYSRIHYGLTVAGKHLTLHFADKAPENLLTGMTAQVEGVQVGEALATSSTSTTTTSTTTTTTASTSVLPNTFGAQKVLVLLVNFQDENTQPVTPAFVYGLTFSNAYSVNNYWLENSFQQTWASGDVSGWYTIPVSSTTCSTSSIATYADQAATAAGVNLSAYAHKVYLFPNNACTWWGYSTIGGSPSQTWIRDYTNSSSGVQVMNIAHELGHSLGLYHSHALNCGSVAYASSGCSSIEYGDTLDFMGNANYVSGGDYNSFQRERLGWVNSGAQPPILSVTSTGSYSLAPYETQDGLTKALKIPAANGNYYYVEFRQPTGFDSFLSSGYTEVPTGVVVHMATPGSANTSELLNMVSSSTGWTSPALAVGNSFRDSTAGVTITPLSVSSAGASVQVTFGTATCTAANPSLSVVGPTSSVAPGSTANYNITITNHDTSACSSSLFNLGAAIPSGWSLSLSSNDVTLAPGASTTVTAAVTSPSSIANGTYVIGVTATNASDTAFTTSASASETIYTPPPVNLSITTNSTSYLPGQTVSVSVTVTSGTSPVNGASVTVSITKANGAVISLSGTTTSKGIATLNYKVKKPDPAGTWNALGMSNRASASTSFAVQ